MKEGERGGTEVKEGERGGKEVKEGGREGGEGGRESEKEGMSENTATHLYSGNARHLSGLQASPNFRGTPIHWL